MKKVTRKCILMLTIFIGFGVINYPFISQYVNKQYQEKVITAYDKQTESVSKQKKQELLEAATTYNNELAHQDNVVIKDAFLENEKLDDSYKKILELENDGIIGYIEIPKISVHLAIYNGTSVTALEAGAGHLEGTSMPIGGKNTHSVISAHNGLPSKLMFTDLDQLVLGDHFFVNVLGNKLAYEVDQIKTVEPSDTKDLQIIKDKDYITLVTCTPYGVNSHRYLVRGHRIDWQETDEQFEKANGKWESGKIICMVSVGMIVLSGLILFLPTKKRREENHT